MVRSCLLSGVLCLCCIELTPTVVAQAPADVNEDLPSEVIRLVRQLDAPQREARQAAEEALVELGPEALDHFPPVTARTPAEVKERLGRARSRLEQAMAAKAAQPSRVTLQGEMALSEAFRQLEEQTGNRLVGYQQRGGRVTLDWKDVPFWQALDQLLDAGDLRINPFGGESAALVIESRPEGEVSGTAQAAYEGLFRFEPLRLEARRDLRNPVVNGLRVTIGISWEPRVRPITLQQDLEQIQVLDGEGQPLTVESGRGRLTASADSGITAVEMTIPLALPDRGTEQIASMRGVLEAVIPGSRAKFQFEQLAEARDVEQTRAGVTVVFERLRRNLDLYEMRVRVRFADAGEALQSHRGWIFNNEAYVLGPDQNRIENVGLQTTRQDAEEVGLAYLFSLPQGVEGHTFVYLTPASILRLPVEFELKDIQLP